MSFDATHTVDRKTVIPIASGVVENVLRSYPRSTLERPDLLQGYAFLTNDSQT